MSNKLRQLLDAATPGPWIHDGDNAPTNPRIGSIERDQWIGSLFADASHIYRDGFSEGDRAVYNAQLIVAMRNCLPELLAVVEAAQYTASTKSGHKNLAIHLAVLEEKLKVL